ncbi:MAG: hypothetical protein NT080_04215 [Spirochaetes bacterium]|nr:hypothetical protein [Spirochaetota bacterium]
MKKFIFLLLAFLVVGSVFGQATVNGYVRAITTLKEDNTLTYVDRLRLNLNFATEDKNVVMFTRLQGTSATFGDPVSANNDIAVKYMWGSVSLFEGKVKATAGKLGNWDYNIASGVSEYNLGNPCNDDWALDGTKALLLQVYPVAGLDLGLAVKTPSAELDMDAFGINAKYSMEGMGAAIFESTLGLDAETSRYSVSAQYTGLEGLTASAGYKHTAADRKNVYGIVNYATGDITAEVATEFNIDDSFIYLEGYLSYVMGDATFNVLFGYDKDAVYFDVDDTYFFGLEAIYKVSAKGLLQASFNYDEVAKWSIPLVVKVSF